MSDEAYGEGVRKGMDLTVARRRCRSALVLPPRPEQYRRVMEHCLEKALHYTPLAERSGDSGHLYLDVSGVGRLFGPPEDIGRKLRATMLREMDLDPIWAVAPNKLLAKVASRLVKPRGEYIVAEDEVASFLDPLPLEIVPGIAAADLHRLHHVNIRRVNQALALSVQELGVLCDHRAQVLYQYIRGIDTRPVLPVHQAREEYSWSHRLIADSNRENVIRSALLGLVQQAGAALRRRQLGCRRVEIVLQYTDGIALSRQAVAPQPVDTDRALQQLAFGALYRAWHRRVRLRTVSMRCLQLQYPVRQLSLFAGDLESARVQERDRQVSLAMDAIRARCGVGKIFCGCQVGGAAPDP
jgi:DNA polymerase-4